MTFRFAINKFFLGVIRFSLFVSLATFDVIFVDLGTPMFWEQMGVKRKISAIRVPVKCRYKTKETALYRSLGNLPSRLLLLQKALASARTNLNRCSDPTSENFEIKKLLHFSCCCWQYCLFRWPLSKNGLFVIHYLLYDEKTLFDIRRLIFPKWQKMANSPASSSWVKRSFLLSSLSDFLRKYFKNTWVPPNVSLLCHPQSPFDIHPPPSMHTGPLIWIRPDFDSTKLCHSLGS